MNTQSYQGTELVKYIHGLIHYHVDWMHMQAIYAIYTTDATVNMHLPLRQQIHGCQVQPYPFE